MKLFHLSMLFVLGLILITSNHAIAKQYYRNCSAWYEVKVTSVGGAAPASHIKTMKVGDFSGRGKCGPYTRINDCRRRARDFCHTCMKDHWKSPITHSQPTSCTYYSGGVGVQNYNIVDLKPTLDRHACNSGSGLFRNELILYDVYRVTSGDKGCGGGTSTKMRVKLGTLRTRCP